MDGESVAAPAHLVSGLPRALTIAGSDSGGGAGIQADLKVFFALGCHGMTALTALTAQNTRTVTGVHEIPPEFIVAQIDAVVEDIGVDAAKTGMLASAPIVEAVAEAIARHRIERLVIDPVFVTKSGDRLLAPAAVASLKSSLFPLAAIVTPNLLEASALLGREISGAADMRKGARALVDDGVRSVLIKGGHLADEDLAVDVFFDGEEFEELIGPRFATKDTHGTGCALSAAITAGLARGEDLLPAVRAAKEYVSGAIEHGLRLGGGYGPVNPGWRLQQGP
ncbi:bifunctional hydroxymethylpyrimidine kinase/phosphomethylpyrimidine kinase [soil metagenome]